MEMQSCFSLRDFYGGGIGERLGVAQGLHADLGPKPAGNVAFVRMLAQAVLLEKELARIMADLDLGALCAVCFGSSPCSA